MGFLTGAEDLAEIFLGFFELGFALFAGFAELGELGLDFSSGGFGFEGFLKRFGVRVGFAAEEAGGVAGRTFAGRTVAAAGGAAAEAEAAAGAGVALGGEDFFHAFGDEFPFGVVLDVELFAEAFQHAGAELGGVEVAAGAVTTRRRSGGRGVLGWELGRGGNEGQGDTCEEGAEVFHGVGRLVVERRPGRHGQRGFGFSCISCAKSELRRILGLSSGSVQRLHGGGVGWCAGIARGLLGEGWGQRGERSISSFLR